MYVLIAEDEAISRLGLKKMLQEMGHIVLEARDGREALQLARRQPPDLAILDINMPYTNGLQAAKTLANRQPLPILLLTAYSEQDLIDEAAGLPIHGYLIKPIQPAELYAAMAVAVRRFHEQALLQEELETRKWLERAKGKLMAEQGLSEQEAYLTIHQLARRRGQSMRQIAEAMLAGAL